MASAPASFGLLGTAECQGGIFVRAFISEESKRVSLFSYLNLRKTLLLKHEWLKSVAFSEVLYSLPKTTTKPVSGAGRESGRPYLICVAFMAGK